ncbi:MAG: multi-sensor signal transduction histidine kinase [Segetibacter sp.]|nr:multi-sensor signal transduction histidine kinase [Segetibacter sp.]
MTLKDYRKKGKKALHSSNNESQGLSNSLERLMEVSLDVICVIDGEGRLTKIGSACEKLFGYTSAELIGKKLIEFVHPDDIERAKILVAQIMSGVNISNVESRYRRKDGTFIPILWVATWSEEDKHMYCVGRDATEQKATLERLKKSEERLANAQKIARLGSWEMDLSTKMVYCSDEFYNIVGRTKEEIGGTIKSFCTMPHPDDLEMTLRSFDTAVWQQGSWDIESRIIQPDGTVVNVWSKGEVLYNVQNQPVWCKGTIQDITEQKKQERERELIIAELTKKNTALKQFSFITCHNLRAPLSNIIGLLSIIDEGVLDETNHELFDLLKTSSHQLQEIINDLTSIILIRNNVNAEITNIDLTSTFERALKTYLNSINDIPHGITVDFKVPAISFYEPYIENIFINLLSNAVKFRSRERTLQIDVTSTIDASERIIITFSDNGLGMDTTKNKDRSFGLYQRFHEGFEGKGLGLFTVKSQVVSVNGTIDIVSEVNKGTSVIMKFPKQQASTV